MAKKKDNSIMWLLLLLAGALALFRKNVVREEADLFFENTRLVLSPPENRQLQIMTTVKNRNNNHPFLNDTGKAFIIKWGNVGEDWRGNIELDENMLDRDITVPSRLNINREENFIIGLFAFKENGNEIFQESRIFDV